MGGGSKTTSVAMPAWLEDAAKYSLGRAEQASKIGYTPYYGPDVAAMTPMQVAAMQGTNTAAGAFGLGTADPMAGMPQAQNFNGMAAYSSGPMYDQALAELQRRQPGQYNALRAPFIDPVTGAQPGASSMQGKSGSGTAVPAPSPVAAPVERGGRGAEIAAERAAASAGGGGRSTTSMATPASYMPGGVNTRNPNSAVNRAAAAMTSKPAGPTAPTGGRAASAPPSRPGASKSAGKGGGSKGGGSKGGNTGGVSRGGSAGRR